MSNAFTNFLGSVVGGFFDSGADMKDYQHASRLYVSNTYARAPKVGFIYFIVFNINKNAISDPTYLQRNIQDVGLLVSKSDLPKFKIQTETLNQYNRKTVIQTKLTYEPVNIEFHDDNSNITTDLWVNYYNYYYRDGTYGGRSTTFSEPYTDTKYGEKDFAYGLDSNQSKRFFDSVDIYVLHKGRGPQDFTHYRLLNPLISDWRHDDVSQNEGSKVMQNKMTMTYEAVEYRKGKIIKNNAPVGFTPVYYDNTPSPLSIGGGIPNTLFGSNGIIAGAGQIFGENGTLAQGNLIGAILQTRNLGKGIGQLSKGGLQTEGYSILRGVLGGVSAAGGQAIAQPGGIASAANAGLNQAGFGALGNIGVNLYANQNYSTNGLTKARPKSTGGGP